MGVLVDEGDDFVVVLGFFVVLKQLDSIFGEN